MSFKQLVVAPSFPYHTHTFVAHEVASTIERGHHVTVLAPTTGDNAGQALADSLQIPQKSILYLNELDCPMWSFDASRFRADIRRVAWSGWYGHKIAERRKTFFCRLLKVLFKRPTPDLIHAHFTGWAFEVAMPLSELLGVPFTFVCHNGNLANFRSDMLSILQERAAKVFLVSPISQEIWANKTGSSEKLEMLPNAVAVEKFSVSPSTGGHHSKPVLVSVCRLVKEKCIQDGVQAVRTLLDRGLECRYHIIGDGPERNRLVAMVKTLSLKDRVIFHGVLPHARVVEILTASDILLHPSELESFGIAIVEGMASGLPVVAARSGGAMSILSPGITGYLYEPGDIETMVAQLAGLLDSPTQRARMGAAGRARAESDFSWNGRMDKLEASWLNIGGK